MSSSTVETKEIEDPRILIPELCRLFYTLKWVTGTGGGISMKYKNNYYLAPSGVQKERIQEEDLFVLKVKDNNDNDKDINNTVIQSSSNTFDGTLAAIEKLNLITLSSPPIHKNFTPSQCTPLFFNAFTLRNASACIHTHSQAAVLVTLLFENEFRITHHEMIKGIRIGSTKSNLKYYDECVVPIIENTPEERDLTDRMAEVMEQYPDCNAVLVRRHGVYVWGDTWQKAKTMCECYDYLFEIAVQMKQLGIDCSKAPANSEYKSLMRTYPNKNTGKSEHELSHQDNHHNHHHSH